MKGVPLHLREPLLIIGGVFLFLVAALIFIGLIWLLKQLKITKDDVAVGKAFIVALVAVLPGVIGLFVARGRVTPIDPGTKKALNPAVK